MTPVKRGTCPTADEIARKAARLFSEKGYDATPVRAIAEAAEVTCPTLYYHFGSKEGLAQALLVEPLRGLVKDVRARLAEPLDPVERLVGIAASYFAFSREDPERARFLYAVMFGPLGRGLAEQVQGPIRELQALLGEAFGRLSAAGIMPEDAVADAALALRGQIVIRTVDFLYHGGALGPDVARRVVERVLHGHARGGPG